MSQYKVSQYRAEYGRKKRRAGTQPGATSKKGRKSYTRVPRNLGPLPITQKAQFVYHEEFNLDAGAAGVPGQYVFSLNGLYDPNISGVGHQPRGFDELMALYDHYVVIGVKAILTVFNSDTTNGYICGMYVKDNATTVTTSDDVLEQRLLSYAPVSAEGSGPNCATISMSVNPNAYLGRSKPMADPELKGSASSNPTEQCYLHTFGIPAPGGTDLGPTYAHLRLEFTTVLIEPKQPGSS